jgi:hypothetical protein
LMLRSVVAGKMLTKKMSIPTETTRRGQSASRWSQEARNLGRPVKILHEADLKRMAACW